MGWPASGLAGTSGRRGTVGLEPGFAGQCFCRSEKRGSATGPNPTDRGKPGTKRHLVVDRHGTPLGVVLSGANRHDSMMLAETLDPSPRRAAVGAAVQPSCMPTRAMIIVDVVTSVASVASSPASHVAASTAVNTLAATAGLSSAHTPGCPSFAASLCATNAAVTSILPSSHSAAPSSA